MFRIVRKETLSEKIKLIEIEAPLIARKAKAGQFVILRLHEKGERIPLTLHKWDPEKGTITLVFQEVGKTTTELGTYEAGDVLADVVGPLGKPTEIERYGKVIVVGGGVGVAIAYAVAKAMKKAGNHVTSIIGFRSKDLVMLEDDMREVSHELIVCTDDGSYGRKGFVTEALKDLLDERRYDLVFAVGPVIMMKFVSKITAEHGVKTIVSLNPIMVDGTGMCGACRVTVGGEVKFACVDGPDFDGHQVDYDELMRRLSMYVEEEKLALERYLRNREVKA